MRGVKLPVHEAYLMFQGLRFAYEDKGWSLSIPELSFGRERITCIVGPNGSGKSTLLRIASGILPPYEGAVTFCHCSLSSMRRRAIARRIAFLPQETPPLFDYTVEEVVQMGRYAHGQGLGAINPIDLVATEHALASMDMVAMRKRPLSHLSGGERRRALIASVLAQEPDIMLLDEPTSALDIHHAAAVMRLLSGFEADGPSVVIVTHDINLAALFGERILLLVNGRLRADGTPTEVICADIMKQAYGEDILVREHPETGGPMIVTRRQDAMERGVCHA
jgi:iron complex transport system ATP-binding protein